MTKYKEYTIQFPTQILDMMDRISGRTGDMSYKEIVRYSLILYDYATKRCADGYKLFFGKIGEDGKPENLDELVVSNVK